MHTCHTWIFTAFSLIAGVAVAGDLLGPALVTVGDEGLNVEHMGHAAPFVGDFGKPFDKVLSEEERQWRDEVQRQQGEFLKSWAQKFKEYRLCNYFQPNRENS